MELIKEASLKFLKIMLQNSHLKTLDFQFSEISYEALEIVGEFLRRGTAEIPDIYPALRQ